MCDFNEEQLSPVESILCMQYCMPVKENMNFTLKVGTYYYF